MYIEQILIRFFIEILNNFFGTINKSFNGEFPADPIVQ